MSVPDIRIENLAINDVKLIWTIKHDDDRGFFSETYNLESFSNVGIKVRFVQDNHSKSSHPFTLRGLHFQTPPYAQDKLVRVVKGSIFDVAVDLRKSSPTFGAHVSAMLSAQEWNQIFVPVGFAHGFMTLEPNTEVTYKVSNHYSPRHDKGILWSDPALAIAWPTRLGVRISPKDERLPVLHSVSELF